MISQNQINTTTAIITEVESHHLNFIIYMNYDCAPEEEDIRGSVKWDGCINWETNGNCMAHFCEVSNMDDLNESFKWVHAEAGKLISHADQSAF